MFPIREALLYDITALAKFHWVLSACSEPARSEWRCKGRKDRRKEGTKPLSRLVPLPPPCHPNKTPHPVRPVTPFPLLLQMDSVMFEREQQQEEVAIFVV